MDPANDTLKVIALPLALAVVVLAVAGGMLVWWLARRRSAAGTAARLRRVCEDMLCGALVPSAETGEIHVEYALLTKWGILVIDVRDVDGHVFGSESMQEWTVLNRSKRSTFVNPLPLLYDRIAAIRRIVPEVPVDGRVVFTPRALFSKGFPPHVAILDSLVDELAAGRSWGEPPPAEVLRESWERLRKETRTRR
jgi:hypothetical protein